MINNDYFELVEKLIHRTKEGKVNWKSTANEDEFIVFFNDFSLSIYISRVGFGPVSHVVISLRDDTGKEIDRFDLDDEDEHYEMVMNLHSSARRKALRIDDALHTIMSELESKNSIGLDEDPRNNDPFFDFDADDETF